MRGRVHDAFGHVGLCMYVYIYIYINGQKNWLFGVLPLENLPLVLSTAPSLSLMAKKGLTTPGNLFWERKLELFY